MKMCHSSTTVLFRAYWQKNRGNIALESNNTIFVFLCDLPGIVECVWAHSSVAMMTLCLINSFLLMKLLNFWCDIITGICSNIWYEYLSKKLWVFAENVKLFCHIFVNTRLSLFAFKGRIRTGSMQFIKELKKKSFRWYAWYVTIILTIIILT